MLKLIFRQWINEPFHTLLTSVAIASALAVIILLEGFQSGLLIQLKNVALNRGADLIVVQKGVSNFVASRSILPQLSRQRIEAVPGVIQAHPITMLPVIYEKAGYRKSPVFFLVYDTGGGPTSIKTGNTLNKPRDVVIDESLSILYDLNIGDDFIVADFKFRIAGITEQASALFTAFAFVNYDDLIDFFFDSDLVGDISNLPLLSYLLIELKPGMDIKTIRHAIEEAEPAADVFTPQQLSNNDARLGDTLFGPVMGVLIGAAYVIALMVVAMIMFAAVHVRQRNFGVMKALGFPHQYMIKTLAIESFLMILMAFPLALLFAIFGAWLIETRVPLYLVSVTELAPLLQTFVMALILSTVGAYLPYRFIARLDPVIVFRR